MYITVVQGADVLPRTFEFQHVISNQCYAVIRHSHSTEIDVVVVRENNGTSIVQTSNVILRLDCSKIVGNFG